MHTSLIIIPVFHHTFPSLQQLPTSHTFPTICFTPLLFSANWGSYWCWNRVSTKDWKNLLFSSHVYARPQISIWNSSYKFLVRFRKKKQVQFNVFPNRFQKIKHSKKALGSKLKVILESIQFQQSRVTPDCLNCQTSVKLSVRRFSQE